jgi:hypothetical protein
MTQTVLRHLHRLLKIKQMWLKSEDRRGVITFKTIKIRLKVKRPYYHIDVIVTLIIKWELYGSQEVLNLLLSCGMFLVQIWHYFYDTSNVMTELILYISSFVTHSSLLYPSPRQSYRAEMWSVQFIAKLQYPKTNILQSTLFVANSFVASPKYIKKLYYTLRSLTSMQWQPLYKC